MNKQFIILLAALLSILTASAENQTDSRAIVAKMTLQEKAELVIGRLWDMDNANKEGKLFDYPGLGMPISGVARLGLPVTLCSDGSYGLRKFIKMGNGKYGSTAFPIPLGMASSWNPAIAKEVGSAFGNEALEYGVDILLGPALNIIRDPLCGRTFEYYGEDPIISGFFASAYTDGIQSQGVGTSIKHFAVNSQETNRIANDARVSTRALREIYLRGFEYVVKHSNPWSLMTAYNRINGTQCGENSDLIDKITRGEWGFKGFFMTDFGGEGWSPLQIAAGNDLVMPGSTYHVQNIINDVKNGELKMSDLDKCCVRIIDYIKKTPHYKHYKYSKDPDLTAHAKIARESALETFVLLKNDDNALPLSGKPALFGVGSYDTKITGIGSGHISYDYKVNVADGFENKNQEVADYYSNYISTKKREVTKGMKFKERANYLERNLLPEAIPTDDVLQKSAKESDIAILTISRNAGEGTDRHPIEGDWLLSKQERAVMEKLSSAFHAAGKKLVVLLDIAGPIETASWKSLADAILVTWLPGQEGGNAIAEVLTGKESPSGKLTVSFPNKYEDCPTFGNFPTGNDGKSVDEGKNGVIVDNDNMNKKEDGTSKAMNSIFENGKTRHQDKPQNELVKNVDYTNYNEDVYVGYRYYDTFGKDVSYPFGFGLSYTSFKYSNMQVTPDTKGYKVKVTVTNTGKANGKEVVEVYMSAPKIKDGRPVHELVVFGKTKELKPGESETLTMHFDRKQLAWYNDAETAWMLEKGKYVITCAASSRDKGISKDITIGKQQIVEKTTSALRPKVQLNLLKP